MTETGSANPFSTSDMHNGDTTAGNELSLVDDVFGFDILFKSVPTKHVAITDDSFTSSPGDDRSAAMSRESGFGRLDCNPLTLLRLYYRR